MLRMRRYDGNDADDFCDICRKGATGQEVVTLEVTGRTYHDRQFVQIHTECFNKKLKALQPREEPCQLTGKSTTTQT